MRTISIKNVEFAYDSARNVKNLDVQALLAGCHQRIEHRPLCMCVQPGIPLQVKRINGVFHLARMPAKGLEHAIGCGFHGETEHSESQSKTRNIKLSFDLKLNQPDAIKGLVTLSGLLNTLWVEANLNLWNMQSPIRSWITVSRAIYKSLKGFDLNGIPISQLLWVMPHMDETLTNNVREGCLNFVRSCNQNGHYALVVAPIGHSEFIRERGSMHIRFRNIDKPPVFTSYSKFAISTPSLKEPGEYPYPVALMLVKASPDKPYLIANDIAMLWMAPGYVPCTTKYHSKVTLELMQSAKTLEINLNTVTGEIDKVIGKALYKYKDKPVLIKTNEPIRQLPWTPHEKK